MDLYTVKSSTALLNLPVEIILDICDELGLKDLLAFAKTNSLVRNAVDISMKQKLANKNFRIYNAIQNISNIRYEDSQNGSDRIPPLSFGSVLYLFRTFGHHIQRLTVYSFGDSVEQKKLFKNYIGKYVALNLKEVEFHFEKEVHPFVDFKEHFPRAKVLRLYGGVAIYDLDLREITPAISKLTIEEMNIISEELNVYFPNVKHFTPPQVWGRYETCAKIINQTLRRNPQIIHLTMIESIWNTMQILNNLRPDLQKLEIKSFDYSSRSDHVSFPFRFRNMTVFKCFFERPYYEGEMHRYRRVPFEFGNLEEIEINRDDLIDDWIEILLQNRNLKKIACHFVFSDDQLQRLDNEIPDLRELKFIFNARETYNTDGIVQFLLRKTIKLQRVSFSNENSICRDLCVALLNSDWENVENSSEICSFVKV